jgi:hypothetical protein
MRPSNAVRTIWNAEAIDTSHLGFRPIQKIATIHASSGFIRGIPDTKGSVCLSLRGWAGSCVLLPERRQAGRAETYFLFSPIGCQVGPLPSIIAK